MIPHCTVFLVYDCSTSLGQNPTYCFFKKNVFVLFLFHMISSLFFVLFDVILTVNLLQHCIQVFVLFLDSCWHTEFVFGAQ